MNYNYATLKELAASNGRTIKDICALSPKNDPFYIGTPAQVRNAEWFAKVWQAGFSNMSEIHLRRIHYWLVSGPLHPHKLPTTITDKGDTYTTYENNNACWKFLGEASLQARYLGLVDADLFSDMKGKSVIYAKTYEQEYPRIFADQSEINLYPPAIPRLSSLVELPIPPALFVTGYGTTPQEYAIEVWAEKSTMNDVLMPLCQEYETNFVYGTGELSLTQVMHFLKRTYEDGRPARILYISDFDGKGNDMPVSIGRKIEYYQQNDPRYRDLDIALQPIVLTADQVNEYDLPGMPVKDSDNTKERFESAYGMDAVELDALEALHAGELRQIVEAEILRYYDPDLQERTQEAEESTDEALQIITDKIHADYSAELDALTDKYNELSNQYGTIRQEFDEVAAPFFEKLGTIRQQLAAIEKETRQVYEGIAEELEANAPAPDPIPEPETDGDPDNTLYASGRDYFTQLEAYKLRKNGVTE